MIHQPSERDLCDNTRLVAYFANQYCVGADSLDSHFHGKSIQRRQLPRVVPSPDQPIVADPGDVQLLRFVGDGEVEIAGGAGVHPVEVNQAR